MPSSKIHLQDLTNFCTLSPIRCAAFAESASVCLESKGHQSGVSLQINGNFTANFSVTWSPLDSSIHSSYLLEESVEDAAYGLSILVIRQLTHL